MTDEEKEVILMELLEGFKKRLKSAADEAISDVYSDILPFILDDTQRNAQYLARDAMQMFLNGQPDRTKGITFPWDAGYVARKIYEANKEIIENAIINAQEEEIDRLKRQLEFSYRNR